MHPKGRHLISAGVLFSALAFSGAYAQSGSTSSPSSSSDRATTAQSTTAPSSGAASRTPSSANSTAGTNTATPSGSAMSDSRATKSSGTDRTQASSGSTDRSQASAGSGENARSGMGANAATQPHAMRASKIIGANVEGANGDDIGEIKDMMVDARNERVRYVVLSHGGVLGIGDKLFAYPMSMVQAKGGDSDKIVMNVNKEKLDKAPGFDKDKWPDFAGNGKYSGQVDQYYGANSDGGKAGKLVRASDLIGKNFDDANGKDAGEIDDLIVDSNSGKIEYAVVDFDDSWAKNTDGKLVAIPLSDIAVSGDRNDKLVIQTSPDSIDMSHAFASNQWPDFSNPSWAQRDRSAARSQTSSAAPTSQGSSGSPRS